MEMASADLSEALRLSPHNRDLHKMILQVKEMIRKRDEEEEGGAERGEPQQGEGEQVPTGRPQTEK